MKVVDPNDWQEWIDNNQDEYGSAIICYANPAMMSVGVREG